MSLRDTDGQSVMSDPDVAYDVRTVGGGALRLCGECLCRRTAEQTIESARLVRWDEWQRLSELRCECPGHPWLQWHNDSGVETLR